MHQPWADCRETGEATEDWIKQIAERFTAAPVGTLLSEGVQTHLEHGVQTLCQSWSKSRHGGSVGGGTGYSCQNTLLRVTGSQFIGSSAALQTEAFGNASMIVVVETDAEFLAVTNALEGNLTGSLYTATDGSDDALYNQIGPILRPKVGRLLNDKMPTGVAVSCAMNHGGPFPATGHPGFTAVGIPASLRRFAMLHCYDAVRPNRLPAALRDQSPNPSLWRMIDSQMKQGDVPTAAR